MTIESKGEERTIEAPLILIAEDDQGLLRLIERNLSRAGFRTRGTVTGRETVESILDSPPDLLLLDYRLPDMSGQEIIRELDEKGCSVPFMVGTGWGDEATAVEMMKMGARDYLVKDQSYLDRLPRAVEMVIDQIEAEKYLVAAEVALKESEDKFRTIFENANDEILYLDIDGNVIDRNIKGEDILGYTREEVQGRRISDLAHTMPEAQMRKMIKMFNDVVAGGEGAGIRELEMTHRNGDTVFVEASISAIRKGGGLEGVLIILRDITERKRMEQSLSQYSVDLEEKLQELRIAYEKLKDLDRMKDNLLSTVSHEIRTPLASIKSFTELLLSYEVEPEVQRDFLNTINEQTDRLTQLVGDFLDLARIESGQIDWSVGSVRIGNVIEKAVSYTNQMACGMNIVVETEIEEALPPVTGDMEKLVQVLSKLVRNAIMFSYSGGKVIIRAEKGETDGSMGVPAAVKVSVIDNGVGIAPSDQEVIFEKFTQVGDILESKPPGTGLGLAICRGIVQRHGGNIRVESEPGKGSTFYFTLPVNIQWAQTRTTFTKNEPMEL